MANVKNNQNKVFETCEKMYELNGVSAVIDHVNEQISDMNPDYADVKFEQCIACNTETPALNHTCLVCGQETKPFYFNIVSKGYNSDTQREEIQIHCGENGNLFLIKTDEGFIVDVYNQDENVNTITVWEEDLNNEENDMESKSKNDSIITTEEFDDFIFNWGQTTEDVCNELGYDSSTSDDLLMVDYFFLQRENKWFPKSASTYTAREQFIADYLRNK